MLMTLAVAAGAGAAQQQEQRPAPEWNPSIVKRCDRACPIGIMDGYMDAIFKHDPKAVPTVALDVRMTENTAPMDIGEGMLWRSKVEPTSFKIYIADPVARPGGRADALESERPGYTGRRAIENRSRKNPGNRTALDRQHQRSCDSTADDTTAGIGR